MSSAFGEPPDSGVNASARAGPATTSAHGESRQSDERDTAQEAGARARRAAS